MTFSDLEDLRPLCRDAAAFEQLKQILAQRDAQRDTQRDNTLPATDPHQATQALEAQRQAAEAASRTKSRFLAMISHELRTPLNSILGLSALLSRQVVGSLNPKQIEYLNYINGSGEHLLAIISDILDLSKVESGQEHLRLTQVSLPGLCQSCLAMVQPRAAEKAIELNCDIAADALTCMADERRLRQMLLNLLSNALKFTPQGQITLTVQNRDALVEFRVEDTGIGIPADRLEQIFQPFTQLDHDLNRQYDGAGLGLALTQQLAQLHGGYLRVESAVDQGSCFFLYLPRPGAGALAARPLGPDHHPSKDDCKNNRSAIDSQQMVIVDRDLEHHQTLIAYVRSCGWQVIGYQSWPEVYQHLHQHPVDLLVVGDLEANNPSLLGDLQQLKPPLEPRPKVAILCAEQAVDLAAQAHIADACIELPLTIPKLERMLAL
ncbi:MAG: sensor histidine kinase [Leptolyngbya sp. DLM2.Bin27]|nr:MAG: sensor histidine kinase [Leptolyngbya sp. DLM2.Bin27]